MKALLWLGSILASLYFVWSTHSDSLEKRNESTPIEAIKLKLSAPKRSKKIIQPKTFAATANVTKSLVQDNDQQPLKDYGDIPPQAYGYDEVVDDESHELESRWNNVLQDFLLRMEPREGERVYLSYLSEIDDYKTRLNSLLDNEEMNNHLSSGESRDLHDMIGELDYLHHERLREILGVHYEAVRSHYEYFMDSNAPRD